MVELTDLVNSVIILLSQKTVLRWLTLLLGPLTVSLTILLFWISFFLLTLLLLLLVLLLLLLYICLVRSKLYPLQCTTGFYKCNTPHCQVGKMLKNPMSFPVM